MPQKKNNIILCISMLVTAAIIIVAIQFSSVKIRDKLNLELQNTMKLSAEQNALFCEQELSTEQSFLRGIARGLPVNSVSQKDALLDTLRPYTELYSVKWLGFIYPDGTAYTTDGHCANLSLEDNFKYGMEGRAYVSDVTNNFMGPSEKINVFSIPVYYENGNTVAGVLFAAYHTETFLDLLNLNCFEGEGYSCIVKPDGSIIAASESSPFNQKENIISALDEMNVDYKFTMVHYNCCSYKYIKQTGSPGTPLCKYTFVYRNLYSGCSFLLLPVFLLAPEKAADEDCIYRHADWRR